MRTTAMAGVVLGLGLAGCALSTQESGDGDSETGEVQEAASTFTSPFKFRKHYVGKSTFFVPVHGTVAVTARATWSRPGACRIRTFTIELEKAGLFGSEGQRGYSTSGTASTQKWTGLGVGSYHLVFDTANDNSACELIGSVTVKVTP